MLNVVMDVDIKLLNIFRVVAQEQSFSAAADLLNTSLPNISMNMSQLESRLEMRLCERGVKGFSLTEHGQLILDASDELYAAIARYRDQVKSISKSMASEIRIGVLSETMVEGKIRIPELLAGLELALPGTHFHLEFDSAERINERVEKGEVHCAIGYFSSLPDSIESRYLYTQRLLCYCSKDHELFDKRDDEINLEVLKDYRTAGFDDLSEGEQQILPFFNKYDSCSRSSEGLLALIMTGNYIGLLAEDFAELWVEKKLIRVIDRNELELTVDTEIIYQSKRVNDRELKALLEVVNALYPVVKRGR